VIYYDAEINHSNHADGCFDRDQRQLQHRPSARTLEVPTDPLQIAKSSDFLG
jgi:hypothetical protein